MKYNFTATKPNIVETLNTASNFVNSNLLECCEEISSFRKTGILKENGKIRDLAKILETTSNDSLSIALEIVKCTAVEMLITFKR